MKNGFVLYKAWDNLISAFSNEEKGALLTAIFNYQCRGILFESENAALQGIFNFMKSQFDSDNEKYEKRCAKNKENVNVRYSSNEE